MTAPASIPQPSYKKPPIIEAVIAVHFSAPLELRWIDAFALKRKARFPRSEDLVELSASFNTQTSQTASNMKKIGRKLSSADGTRVILIMPAQIAVIQRAPYTDWNILYNEAREHWNVLSKLIKHKTVSHVSTRYINRIDIPVDTNGRVDLSRYFHAGLSLPPYVQAMQLQAFHINCTLQHPSEQYRHVLQFASTASSLIDHLSFLIDIDIATTSIVSSNEDEMWELVGSLRQYKNELFESCITPETRKLFQ